MHLRVVGLVFAIALLASGCAKTATALLYRTDSGHLVVVSGCAEDAIVGLSIRIDADNRTIYRLTAEDPDVGVGRIDTGAPPATFVETGSWADVPTDVDLYVSVGIPGTFGSSAAVTLDEMEPGVRYLQTADDDRDALTAASDAEIERVLDRDDDCTPETSPIIGWLARAAFVLIAVAAVVAGLHEVRRRSGLPRPGM